MKIKINNFTVSILEDKSLREMICQRYSIQNTDIEEFRILRQAIDARKKNNIQYNYQLFVQLTDNKEYTFNDSNISLYEPPQSLTYPQWKGEYPPVVVGFGPAGMFAALYLARCQANPIIIERGSSIEKRKEEIATFLKTKQLNEDSNILFGEGGAGTFSDGKLTTNLHNEWIDFILQEFYKHGATEDITYVNNPHVGTDYLEKVVKNIREEIISLGGQFHFNTIFSDFDQTSEGISVKCIPHLTIQTQQLLLCIGHSAKDTLKHLYSKGLNMEPKSFSIGVRIEHLQSKINRMQYGDFANHLPAASYKGVVHLTERSVYTFCMCPGGVVMASSNEKESIVTNGMSEKKRDKTNANSALLVNVTPSDYYKDSPLDGLNYQEQFEKKAFALSGDYKAPVNLVREFLKGKIAQSFRSVKPSYPHGTKFCDLNGCLPNFVIKALREAIPKMDQKIKGFNDPDAILTGVETRSSSPVRILRNEARESNIQGVFPVGEGAGYAGGITSAAIDGLKTAFLIVNTHSKKL